jgi:hypothetical protein
MHYDEVGRFLGVAEAADIDRCWGPPGNGRLRWRSASKTSYPDDSDGTTRYGARCRKREPSPRPAAAAPEDDRCAERGWLPVEARADGKAGVVRERERVSQIAKFETAPRQARWKLPRRLETTCHFGNWPERRQFSAPDRRRAHQPPSSRQTRGSGRLPNLAAAPFGAARAPPCRRPVAPGERQPRSL